MIVATEWRGRLYYWNMVARVYAIPRVLLKCDTVTCHQEVGSMFPLCECVWICDYRRRDAT